MFTFSNRMFYEKVGGDAFCCTWIIRSPAGFYLNHCILLALGTACRLLPSRLTTPLLTLRVTGHCLLA